MGPRAGLDGWKISSLPGFDPGPSCPYSVTIPTELPGELDIVKEIKIRRVRGQGQLFRMQDLDR